MQYMKLDDPSRAELLRELATMPGWLQQEFGALPVEKLTAAGPDGLFSPVEQVWHLADLEAEGFGARIDRLLREAHPHLPDFDGTAIARARDYRSLSLAQGLERFAAARRANLERLRATPEAAWTNTGLQEGVGEVTLCDMPMFLRQHDLAHREEIRRWFRDVGSPRD
jgi:hypothetical protein